MYLHRHFLWPLNRILARDPSPFLVQVTCFFRKVWLVAIHRPGSKMCYCTLAPPSWVNKVKHKLWAHKVHVDRQPYEPLQIPPFTNGKGATQHQYSWDWPKFIGHALCKFSACVMVTQILYCCSLGFFCIALGFSWYPVARKAFFHCTVLD